MSDTFKWFFLGDLQIPYQDNRAVALTLKVMKSWKPDAIDFVGDIDDQLEYSRYSDGTTDEFFNVLAKNQKANGKDAGKTTVPRLENPLPFIKENAEGARKFYTDVRKQHKNADLHASLGNHDIRIFDYIDKKAPDYIDEVTPNMLWSLDDLGITWRHYELPPFQRHGGIFVHHGTTSSSSTGLAVRGDIEQFGISLVRGHDHRGGVVYKTYPMTGQKLAGMGTGHLCDPSAYGLRYTINPSWEQGFGIAHIEGNNTHLQFIPITPDYTCVVDGRLFEG